MSQNQKAARQPGRSVCSLQSSRESLLQPQNPRSQVKPFKVFLLAHRPPTSRNHMVSTQEGLVGTRGKAPAQTTLGPRGPSGENYSPGIPNPQPLTTARRASGFQPIGSPLIRPSPGQCCSGQGSPDACGSQPRRGKPQTEGTPRHRGGGNTRRSSAQGGDTARPNAPPHERPAGPKKPRSRPVGLRASAIRPPY